MSEDTPAGKWRINGEPDPFGDRFNCLRKHLSQGMLTDDEMANEVFMNPHIGNLQAAKERIRWLSRRSEQLQATNQQLLEALLDAEEKLSILGFYEPELREAITNAKQREGL